jgi:hypothetical protein
VSWDPVNARHVVNVELDKAEDEIMRLRAAVETLTHEKAELRKKLPVAGACPTFFYCTTGVNGHDGTCRPPVWLDSASEALVARARELQAGAEAQAAYFFAEREKLAAELACGTPYVYVLSDYNEILRISAVFESLDDLVKGRTGTKQLSWKKHDSHGVWWETDTRDGTFTIERFELVGTK